MSPHPRRDEVACGQQSGALGVYVLSGDDVVKRRLPARSGDAQACAWLPWPATGTSEEGNERGLQEGIIGEGRPEDGPGGRRARAGCDAVVVGRRADEPEEDPVAPEVPAAPVGGAAGQVVAVARVVDRRRTHP
jgi:hypothetical protein